MSNRQKASHGVPNEEGRAVREESGDQTFAGREAAVENVTMKEIFHETPHRNARR